MNLADKLLVCITLLLFLYAQAKEEAKRFEQKLTISHFGKAALYGCFVLFWIVAFVEAHGWWYVLKISVIAILERAAFFNLILNIIRKKKNPLFYNGKDTTGSKIDQEENKLPDWALKTLKIAYIIGFIIAIIFIK